MICRGLLGSRQILDIEVHSAQNKFLTAVHTNE